MTFAMATRKKIGATRRTFNIGDDLYLKLRKVAHLERLNATQQLERSLDKFFDLYEAENGVKLDEVELPEEE